jgi:hypothetical protein
MGSHGELEAACVCRRACYQKTRRSAVLQEIEMTKRRVIVLTLTAAPDELRYLAGCINVGNDEDNQEVPAYHYNQAEALAGKLERIAHAIETERFENTDFMIPFIQDHVVQGAAGLAADRETVASGAPTS